MKLTELLRACHRTNFRARYAGLVRGNGAPILEENLTVGIEKGTSELLCPCESLDDFGHEMSRYPGFAIIDGLDRFGEKWLAVFRF